jgi:peptidoglycan/xylan/chitin deacetylase (PgdA/CDA1 family)
MLHTRRFGRPGTVVLMYHRIGSGELADRDTGEAVYAVPAEALERHLDVLQESGCAVVPLAEAGETTVRPDVAITFDDGNASDRLDAAPRLARRGLMATFFLSPGLVGRPGYLGWEEARELLQLGMEIGSHGWDHRPLGGLTTEAVRVQLGDAKHEIEARLAAPCLSMSLPNGSGGRRELALARQLGYRSVVGSIPGRVIAGTSGVLPRVALRSGDPIEWFRAVIEQRPLALGKARLRYLLLRAGRATLGQRLYSRIRARWAGAGLRPTG